MRVRCEAIALLQHARPAVSSELRTLSLADPGILSVLPAVLATAVSNEQNEARTAAGVERLPLVKLDPNAGIVEIEGAVVTIAEDLEFSFIRVQIVARGDFNADGTDDIVLSVLNVIDVAQLWLFWQACQETLEHQAGKDCVVESPVLEAGFELPPRGGPNPAVTFLRKVSGPERLSRASQGSRAIVVVEVLPRQEQLGRTQDSVGLKGVSRSLNGELRSRSGSSRDRMGRRPLLP